MFFLILFLILNTLAPLAYSNLFPEYAQCNGANWPAPKECRTGLKCQRKDQWYSQCLKSCPDSWECKQTECIDLKLCDQNTIQEFGQCGGVNYKGLTKCAVGLSCFKNNKWYSQCLKKCPCGWDCCEKVASFLPITSMTPTKSQITTILSKFTCQLRYGRNYDSKLANYSNFDFITLWLGKTDSNCPLTNSKNLSCTDFNLNDLNILNKIKSFLKVAVFKANIIETEARNLAGLNACGLQYSLCDHGAKFIRENMNRILERYEHFTSKIQYYLSKTGSHIFLIEPNFWQFYGYTSQSGGPLTGQEMRTFFQDICSIIKRNLPNSMISWDADILLNENAMETWWNYFKDSKSIDFIHTSSSNHFSSLPLKFMSELTGKQIILLNEGGENDKSKNKWNDQDYVKDKTDDGVVMIELLNDTSHYLFKPRLC